MKKNIYLDYNATTPVSKSVLKVWTKIIQKFGNPSSLHQQGQDVKNIIEESRSSIARIINCKPDQLIFTSSATESNNMVIKTFLNKWNNSAHPTHIITSNMEHSSVRESCRYLEKCGVKITWLNTDEYGIISPEQVKNSMNSETKLITLMLANNETGVIQPIKEITKIAKENNVKILTDAVQCIGKMSLDINDLDVDYLSLCGHKIYAPKGIGLLYVKDDEIVDQLLHGGSHERNLRAGTENSASIAALAKAFEDIEITLSEDIQHLAKMKNLLILELRKQFPDILFNGNLTKSLCNTLNFSLPKIEGHALAINLDLEGISISTGSACSTGSVEPSPVLEAMRLDRDRILGAVRISMGRETNEYEILSFVDTLAKVHTKMTSN